MKPSLLQRLRRGDAVLWAALLGVLPLPLWFMFHVVVAPRPAWRGDYHPRDPSGPGTPAVAFEREMARYWDRNERLVPGGANPNAFSARWQACMRVEQPRQLPVMLVASGAASFSLDGQELLRIPPKNARRSVGAVLALSPGIHLLSVELASAGWPSIALQASFDGEPPAPLGSGRVAPGVTLSPPSSEASPCIER